jgi:hypothetical protein
MRKGFDGLANRSEPIDAAADLHRHEAVARDTARNRIRKQLAVACFENRTCSVHE